MGKVCLSRLLLIYFTQDILRYSHYLHNTHLHFQLNKNIASIYAQEKAFLHLNMHLFVVNAFNNPFLIHKHMSRYIGNILFIQNILDSVIHKYIIYIVICSMHSLVILSFIRTPIIYSHFNAFICWIFILSNTFSCYAIIPTFYLFYLSFLNLNKLY